MNSPETPVITVDSKIPKIRVLDPADRLAAVCSAAYLSKSEQQALSGESVLPISLANSMIENVIGKFELPLGCLLYTSPSPRDATLSRMPSSA